MTNKHVAAIDLGTNSCRLLIADMQGRYVLKETVNTKLGEGLYPEMLLTDAAMERGIKCFYEYKKIMDKYDVVNYRAIATAACRMAKNAQEFIRRVYGESLIKIEIIDGKEEARLNLIGALSHVCGKTDYVLLYDLGGGSTEITLATNTQNPQILEIISIPWGARNSSEVFNLSEYNPENAEKLRLEINDSVQKFREAAALDKLDGSVCCVATSSTPLRLVAMNEDFGVYDREKADGHVLTVADTDKVIEKICKMSCGEMLRNPYVGDKRAKIFIAACIIFKTIYDGLGINEFAASLKSAKDGIIEELVKEEELKNAKVS